MATVSAYEQCKTKLHLAELYHKQSFSQDTKNVAAQVIKNTINAYEAVSGLSGGNSGVAQLNPISSYKNYIIKLTTLGIPALDVFDWVATEAMATANTQILFTKYVRMSDKGNSQKGDVIADPFGIYYRGSHMDSDREDATDYRYQSERTVDAFVNGNTTDAQGFNLRWTPIRKGSVKVTIGDTVADEVTGTATTTAEGYDYTFIGNDVDDDGNKTENGITVSINYTTGAISITTGTASEDNIVVNYDYDNVNLPANDIPTYGAVVEAIPMVAKPHKVRIVFDALSNLIYKNDYGIDIAKELPKKAVEDFMYSIAMEVSDAIVEAAPTSRYTLNWGLSVQNGWIAQHYASFGSVLQAAAAAITKITKIFAGNRVFIGSALVPVVMAVPGFKATNTDGKIGTQLIGTLGNMKIYYKQNMDDYTYVVFSKGTGTEFCVGLLGMYMSALPASIVPTQLLEFADGLNEQGFYSLYDFKIINPMLSVKGVVSPAN
ncbi:MAG: hypothetical protein LUC16_01965 [Coprobacillus sp.]|nr:hypothetical protein [Coprobacillus sp.]